MNLQFCVDYGQAPPEFATSASGAMSRPPDILHLLLRGPIFVEGTAARHQLPEDWANMLPPQPQTSAGSAQPEEAGESESTAAAIMELRRLSGLTWEQLARLFGVARRSLHFWASGKLMNAPNEERLRRVLAVIRTTDRGFAAKNRAMLFEDRDGAIPFDLLVRGEYDTFMTLTGTGRGRRKPEITRLSPEAHEARKPQPPEELVGALQNRAHVERGRLISSTPVRHKRQE